MATRRRAGIEHSLQFDIGHYPYRILMRSAKITKRLQDHFPHFKGSRITYMEGYRRTIVMEFVEGRAYVRLP
ncbi:MAG TPA: hypothetical protein VFG02_05050 [Nitrospirota bacterium]|nr:hypothetical protein [Nitrospirota bacterium]